MAYYKNYESSTPGSMQGNQWPVWPKPPVIQIGSARQKYYGTHDNEAHNDEAVYLRSQGIRSKDFLSRPDQPRLAKAGNWVDGSLQNMTPCSSSLPAPWGEWLQFGSHWLMWCTGCDSWWAEWRKKAAGSSLVFTGVLDDVPHFYAPQEYTESLSFKDCMPLERKS